MGQGTGTAHRLTSAERLERDLMKKATAFFAKESA